ncbi:MAG TPA: hypothetical protein VNZ86_04820 [Bacteroidia bacterium]|jgi:hypothetical protein|nr:hypothetical protein [Bacteroidia bacterium]
MLYITFNDAPSGIYFSQVTSVCRYLEAAFKVRIKLIAFLSVRSFRKNRRAIQAEYAGAWVIPMIPKLSTWRWNRITLFFILLILSRKKETVCARGPYAAWLALKLKKAGLIGKVCLDARGAYQAELNEYPVTDIQSLVRGMAQLEKQVLLNADFRIAVSQSLVRYWQTEYGYDQQNHVVIPCTLHPRFQLPLPEFHQLETARTTLGFKPDDCLLAYSGSHAGWQSFSMVRNFLSVQLQANPALKILFLCAELPEGIEQDEVFRSRYIRQWMKPSEVRDVLCLCDYGLIIRESSVTNRVSSPVKFAEYLACGLGVLISPGIGDYSDFVEQHGCGQVIKDAQKPVLLTPLSFGQKQEWNKLARARFSKETYQTEYQKLLA